MADQIDQLNLCTLGRCFFFLFICCVCLKLESLYLTTISFFLSVPIICNYSKSNVVVLVSSVRESCPANMFTSLCWGWETALLVHQSREKFRELLNINWRVWPNSLSNS